MDVCALLIHAKANLQLCDKHGRTPLQIAQTQAQALLPYVGGHEQVKKLLQKVHDDGELIAEAAKNGNLRQIRGCVQGAPGVTKLICLQRGTTETPKKATSSEQSSAPRRLWETSAQLLRTATAAQLSSTATEVPFLNIV